MGDPVDCGVIYRMTGGFSRKICGPICVPAALTTEPATGRKNRPPGSLVPEGGSFCLSGLFPGPQGSDLLFHPRDHPGQLFLTLGLGWSVDVPGHALPVDFRRVPSLPEVVIDLGDAAGARLAVFSFDRLEGRPGRLFRSRCLRLGGPLSRWPGRSSPPPTAASHR